MRRPAASTRSPTGCASGAARPTCASSGRRCRCGATARPTCPISPTGNRFLHLHFCLDDPLAVWDEQYASIGPDLAAAGLGEILFASPFLATVLGTDTYTDELW